MHLPNEIREYFVSAAQTPDYPSFSAIINCMLSTEDHGVMGQIAEMIRRLIDIEAVRFFFIYYLFIIYYLLLKCKL